MAIPCPMPVLNDFLAQEHGVQDLPTIGNFVTVYGMDQLLEYFPFVPAPQPGNDRPAGKNFHKGHENVSREHPQNAVNILCLSLLVKRSEK